MFSFASVETFFPTFLWVHDLEPERATPMNARLLSRLDELTSPRPQIEPGENWQTEQRLHEVPDFAELVEVIGFATDQVLKYMAVDTEGFEITGCWGNLSPKGAGHRAHHHSNNYLSGVYYLQVPPGADSITFTDPRIQVEQIVPRFTELTANNSTAHDVNIMPGRLVIFPAWLAHSVRPNPSDQLRISISFNIMFSDFTRTVSSPRWSGIPLHV